MRKLLTTVSAIALAGGLAFTVARAVSPSTIPLFTGAQVPGCEEGSQTVACLNNLIQQLYTGATGNFAYVPGPVQNSGTSNTTANLTLAQAVIPTGTVLVAGSGYRTRCAGLSTVTTSGTGKIGIAVGRSMQVSLENNSLNNALGAESNWDLEIEFRTAVNQTAATPSYTWMARAFAAQATGTATGESVVISGNDVTVTDNTFSFAVPITCVMYSGAATGLVTMMNFSVEQLR